MALEIIKPTTVHPTIGYSHAARIGDIVYVSGQVALSLSGELVGKGDVRAQTEQVFENLKNVLEAAGSGLDRIAKLTVLAIRLKDSAAVGEIRNRIFGPFGYAPASTFAVVASLALPDYLVEIEAVASVK